MNGANISSKNIKICESFSQLVRDSIKNDKMVNLDKLDELYLKLKQVIKDNNDHIGEWYDEEYHSNVFDMNININQFATLINKQNHNMTTIKYC